MLTIPLTILMPKDCGLFVGGQFVSSPANLGIMGYLRMLILQRIVVNAAIPLKMKTLVVIPLDRIRSVNVRRIQPNAWKRIHTIAVIKHGGVIANPTRWTGLGNVAS